MIYLLIVVLAFLFELLYFKIASKYNIVDRPSERGSSNAVTLRGGGIVFPFVVLVYFIYSGFAYPWFIVGMLMISCISFYDDVSSLPPRIRLLVHFVAMLLMCQQLGLLTSSLWWLIPIMLFVCAGAINVFNFMDGVNGITGGYALVVLVALLYVNHHVVEFVDPRFILFSLISVLVFCFFNFRTRAKCFAGDVGAVAIAFVILFFICKLVLLTNDFSWFAFLAVYGVDGTLTLIHRILLHEKLSEPHRKHAYQLMANELKIPHVLVSAIYMCLQALACFVYLLNPGLIMFAAVVVVLSLAYILFMKRFFHLHLQRN
jgi:hypothetical protein